VGILLESLGMERRQDITIIVMSLGRNELHVYILIQVWQDIGMYERTCRFVPKDITIIV
jgi:hypothetical protein